MDVVARSDADRAGVPRALWLQQFVSGPKILRRGELAIAFGAFDQGDIEAEPFGNAAIVGEIAIRLFLRGSSVGREDRVERESLRGLRLPQAFARDGTGHAAAFGALQ